MDIKEIALKICRGMNPYSDLHESEFIYFANKLIESYKAELLNEVGEPTCWMTPDGEGWRMRTKPPETDTKLGWMEFYASDQVATAILKATKPLEDQLAAAQEEITRLEKIVISAQNAAIENASEVGALKSQLSKAEQRVIDACCSVVDERFDGCEPWIDSDILRGEWRKFVKEEV